MRLADLAVCHSTCFMFAMDDQQLDAAARGANQHTTCGSFFIQACPFNRGTFEEFDEAVYTPPALPPAPMPPLDATSSSLAPVAIHADDTAGRAGFDRDAMEVDSESAERAACTDGTLLNPARTLCQTLGATTPYVLLSFQFAVLVHAVDLVLFDQFSPPAPPYPSAPDPAPPPRSPNEPAAPPVPPPPSPLPATPCNYARGAKSTCAVNLVVMTDDGVCDDGLLDASGAPTAQKCAVGRAAAF